MKNMKRASGVLLHITSLPSNFGIGDLGPCSYRFAEILATTNQHYWNILPITPTDAEHDNSPYQPTSAFAGNVLLISPEELVKDGLLSKQFVDTLRLPPGPINFKSATYAKKNMLKKAHENFSQKKIQKKNFEEFCAENKAWLDDFALFGALTKKTKMPWYTWQKSLRNREKKALIDQEKALQKLMEKSKFEQFIFYRQWRSLKGFLQARDIKVIGDLPFYMSLNSADIWVNQSLFKLNSRSCPLFVGGVPPDYFSKDGQRWENPVYSWPKMKKSCFQWWNDRIKHNLELCDLLRLDHFRGFTSYWQIPASNKTAKKGRWIKASPTSFFKLLKHSFPNLPFIAEDLGSITNSVKKNLTTLGIPGMRVLLFAFNGTNRNPHLPNNYPEQVVVFTGTHDTNTAKGWYVEEASTKQKQALFKNLGKEVDAKSVSWELTKFALSTRAKLSIIPVQDLLSLGSEARMNHPAQRYKNWIWRLTLGNLENSSFQELGVISQAFAR